LADVSLDATALVTWQHVTVALFLVALVAGFAQFGAVASLDDVARHFGHHAATQTLQRRRRPFGLGAGYRPSRLRLASLGALPLASLADRWGRTTVLRRTLLVGLVVTACASLSPTYWFFVLCFALASPLLSVDHDDSSQVVTVELSSTKARGSIVWSSCRRARASARDWPRSSTASSAGRTRFAGSSPWR
jgi:hypothetical protein